MDQSSSERREELLKSIRDVESGIAENEAIIEQMGPQFSLDQTPDQIPEDQRKAYKKFRRAADALAENRAQLAKLKAKLAQMQQGAGGLDMARQQALRWLNGLASADQFLAELKFDPSMHPEAKPAAPDRKVAKRILNVRDAQPGGQLAELDLLRSINGVNDVLVNDIAFTGTKLLVSPPVITQPVVTQPVVIQPVGTDPVPAVGVLLPVRIETRFYPPSKTPNATWHLRVRIIPDEASIDRHSKLASDFELDSVEAMWRDVGLSVTPMPVPPARTPPTPAETAHLFLSGDNSKKKNKWAAFAARHGGPRAAWLARKFPPIVDSNGIHIQRPDERRKEPDFGRIVGFPKTIELWMGRGGKKVLPVKQMPVDTSKLTLDFPDLDSTESSKRWWSSWKTAVEVGLGVEIDLGPEEPNDIDVLYVVGLGTDEPADLFRDHRDAGVLALMKPGTPTNTISGKPAADLASDPEVWRQVVLLADTTNEDVNILGEALTGDPRSVSPVPGAGLWNGRLDQSMMQVLGPLFWIQTLKTIWGINEDNSTVVPWAVENVFPIGPLPPIRIGEQPYGILPATSLANWKASKRDLESEKANLEGRLRGKLASLRSEWSTEARKEGTISGANADKLVGLLGRNPVSKSYSYRLFKSLELLAAFYAELAKVIPLRPLNTAFGAVESLEEWWDKVTEKAVKSFTKPKRKYWTMGYPQDLKVPLVTPANSTLKDVIEQLVIPSADWPNIWFDGLPNSLLITLTRLSVIVTAAAAPRSKGATLKSSVSLFELESVDWDDPQSTLESLARSFVTDKVSDELFDSVCDAAKQLVTFPTEDIERSMLAALDSFSYRIDPWITAYAWRRLKLYHAPDARWQLGIYGWVDNPKPADSRGPEEFILAPSDTQALAAVVLRDKAITDPQKGRWDMKLESDTIRLARMLVQQIRAGLHPSEALGSEIERIIADRTAIDKVRMAFPIREEHQGRRVCDGLAILAALRDSTGLKPVQTTALELITKPHSEEMGLLLRSLDAYSDMLIAEAAYYMVTSRADRASAVMDAAVGMAPPPEVEVLDFPSTGRNVSTGILIALSVPGTPASTLEESSPGFLADPAVSRFLEEVLGSNAGASWRWEVDTADTPPVRQSVSLSVLGLLPIDAVMISEEQLIRLVLDVHPGSRLADAVPRLGTETHRHAVRIVRMLASRAALPSDLLEPGRSLQNEQEINDAIEKELKVRFHNLRDQAIKLRENMKGANTGAEGKRLLLQAARWGITPVINPSQPSGQALSEAVSNAAKVLDERLAVIESMNIDNQASPQVIASAISRLASSDALMPVLSRFSLRGNSRIFDKAETLDENWLTVVASVRASLARVEVFQLDALLKTSPADDVIKQNWKPLVAMTNREADPWQTKPAPEDPKTPDKLSLASKLICVYGTSEAIDDAIQNKTVALGSLDTWAEVIPAHESNVTVAFRFNAPRARAPQAILLAVPPDETEQMSTQTLVTILEETRELARARMATPDDLKYFSAALPFTMLPFYDGIHTEL